MSERETNIRQVREAVDSIQSWIKRLEQTLAKQPDIIPWTCLEGIQEGASKLIYSAGRVNGAHFESQVKLPTTKDVVGIYHQQPVSNP